MYVVKYPQNKYYKIWENYKAKGKLYCHDMWLSNAINMESTIE